MKNIIILMLFSLSDENIGWMHGNCLAIKNHNLDKLMDVRVVRLDGKNITEKAMITEETVSGDRCLALMEDRSEVNINSGYSFYLIDSETPIDLAIAVVGSGKINPENFYYCSTSEGIRYYIKDSSETTWEGYYYLGYGSEVTCKDNP